MKLDLPAVVAEAAGHWRRDRDLVVAVAGPFFFLPNLALGLLASPGAADGAGADGARTGDQMLAALGRYVAENAHWLAIQTLAELIGTAVLLALFLDRSRPTVGDALRTQFRRAPVLIAAELLVNVAKVVGLMLFVLPGLYVIGRAFVVLPVLVAEPERRFGDAMSRAVALTDGQVLPILTVSAVVFLTGQTAALLLSATAAAVSSGGINPVTAGMLAAAVAFVGAAMSTAFALMRAAVYRGLAIGG